MRLLQIFIISSFLLLVFISFFKPITAWTQDLGRHIKTGEIILINQSVPRTNIFSYTYPDYRFINTHWLSGVLFFLIHNYMGETTLLIIMSIIATCGFGIIFIKPLRLLPINTTPLFIFLGILYFQFIQERTDLRPELFSFFIFSIYLAVLYAFRKKVTRKIFLLIPLQLLWVNLHIYFVIGIITIFLFFLEALWQDRNYIKNGVINSSIRIFILVLFLSSIVCIINPNGIDGALYPFFVLNNYGYSIQENQNILFLWNYSHSSNIMYFCITIFVLLISFVSNFHKLRIIDILLSIFFIYLGATTIRNLPLFALATFPAIVYNFNFITEYSYYKKKLFLLCIFSLFLILYNIYSLFYSHNKIITDNGAKNAVDFYLKNGVNGPIFNNFDIGSYLDYRLYPKEKVFVDSRPEAYPSSFFQEIYIPMQQEEKKFEEMQKKYNINTIFFAHTDQTPWASTFLYYIMNNDNWRVIYLDEYAVILVRNIVANQNLIKLSPQKNNMATIYNLDYISEVSLLQIARLFKVVAWNDREKDIYKIILFVNPQSCIALYNLYLSLSKTDNISAGIYLYKYQSFCK